jgi:cytochrome b subunit of formate dehydrogenase
MQIFWKKVSHITTVMNIVLVTGQLFFKPYFQQWNSAYFIVMACALFAFVIAQIALFLIKKAN